ncbi:MAG: hypothetical protein AAGH74_04455, partial [Pseudomonadota bacterium]
ALGQHGVSIHRMRQYGSGDPVPVVIVTHDAQRAEIDGALAEIASLEVSKAPPVAIRIETVEPSFRASVPDPLRDYSGQSPPPMQAWAGTPSDQLRAKREQSD